MAARGGAAGTAQHGKGVEQHQDGHAQAHAGQGGGAYFGQVADINAVYNVVQQVDDLRDDSGQSQLQHPAADTAAAHVLLGGCDHEKTAPFTRWFAQESGGRPVRAAPAWLYAVRSAFGHNKGAAQDRQGQGAFCRHGVHGGQGVAFAQGQRLPLHCITEARGVSAVSW